MAPAKPNRPLRPSLAWVRKEKIRKAEQAEQAKQRLRKQEEAQQAEAAGDMKQFNTLLVAMRNDCDRISGEPSITKRLPIKRDCVNTWLPFVEKYIESGEIFANEIFIQVIIWLFDLGEIDDAMRLADIAIDQKQPMPKRFNRDLKTFIADTVYDWARERLAASDEKGLKTSVEPYFSDMLPKVREWPLPDQVKIKYLKLAATLAETPEGQLALYEEAVAVNKEFAKCKTAIDKVKKILEKKAAAGEPGEEITDPEENQPEE